MGRHRPKGKPGQPLLVAVAAACAVAASLPPSTCFHPLALGGTSLSVQARRGRTQTLPGRSRACGSFCRRQVLTQIKAVPAARPAEETTEHLKAGLATLLAAVTLVTWAAWPTAATARDGTVSPPTCVAIINAAENCPARPAVGAAKNAEGQLKVAQDRQAAAEKEAGKTLALGESERGEPEMVEFWKKELQRLDMNRVFLKDLQDQLAGGKQPRLVSRLSIEAPDLEKEETFWCEALGMQRYATLPGGGVVVAFGPPGIKGEEGAYFSVELRPVSGQTGKAVSSEPGKARRLSFVQTTTPALIRISRVVASGGQLIDGYGYYDIKSPAGVEVRAYVEDRRDPVEFVAFAVPPDRIEAESRSLQQLGLEPRGPYQLVSPEMQAYMPPLPEGNVLLGSGDPKQNVQILLLPEIKDEKPAGSNPLKALQEQLGRGPTAVINTDGSFDVGVLDEKEKAEVPISSARGPKLTIYGPAGASTASSKEGAAEGSLDEVQVALRSISEAG